MYQILSYNPGNRDHLTVVARCKHKESIRSTIQNAIPKLRRNGHIPAIAERQFWMDMKYIWELRGDMECYVAADYGYLLPVTDHDMTIIYTRNSFEKRRIAVRKTKKDI